MCEQFTTDHLYAASRVQATFRDGSGESSFLGTGVILRGRSGALRFVTNRHVVDRAAYLDGASSLKLTKLLVKLWQRAEDVSTVPNASWIDVGLPDMELPSDGTVDLAAFNLPIDDGPLASFALNDDILARGDQFEGVLQAGEAVLLAGFPDWCDANGKRPVLRAGVIASDPRNGYRVKSGEPSKRDGNETVAIDVASSPGCSGGPVFVAGRETGRVEQQHPVLLLGLNADEVTRKTKSGDDEVGIGVSRVYKSIVIGQLLDNLDRRRG
ncbi:serine protease [Actinoplanes sp. NPDC089786]|uniref:S1 family peptidase n=1 Tax=Actinoplanes sp. NPDC089786 TaxID=3155185 RepID=UPI00341C151C